MVVDPCGAEQAQQRGSATLAAMTSANLVRHHATPGAGCSHCHRWSIVMRYGCTHAFISQQDFACCWGCQSVAWLRFAFVATRHTGRTDRSILRHSLLVSFCSVPCRFRAAHHGRHDVRHVRTVPAAAQVTGAELGGQWGGGQAREAMAVALGGCAQLDALMRETLKEAAAA